jgi:hypothetical protein
MVSNTVLHCIAEYFDRKFGKASNTVLHCIAVYFDRHNDVGNKRKGFIFYLNFRSSGISLIFRIYREGLYYFFFFLIIVYLKKNAEGRNPKKATLGRTLTFQILFQGKEACIGRDNTL